MQQKYRSVVLEQAADYLGMSQQKAREGDEEREVYWGNRAGERIAVLFEGSDSLLWDIEN